MGSVQEAPTRTTCLKSTGSTSPICTAERPPFAPMCLAGLQALKEGKLRSTPPICTAVRLLPRYASHLYWQCSLTLQPLLFLGDENRTQMFFSQTFRALPGYPGQIPGYPGKKFDSLGFEGHTELFGPHPFTWKTPTPPENIRTQKIRFGFFFRA